MPLASGCSHLKVLGVRGGDILPTPLPQQRLLPGSFVVRTPARSSACTGLGPWCSRLAQDALGASSPCAATGWLWPGSLARSELATWTQSPGESSGTSPFSGERFRGTLSQMPLKPLFFLLVWRHPNQTPSRASLAMRTPCSVLAGFVQPQGCRPRCPRYSHPLVRADRAWGMPALATFQ